MQKWEPATGSWSCGRLYVGLLACSLGLHAQSADNNPKALVRIHGSVVNAVTHAPIPRALVTSADQRMAVMTDDKGRFEFDVNLAPGNASGSGLPGEIQTPFIVVKKPGYLAPTLPMPLPLDDLAALKADLRLQLMPEAAISGSAVSATEEVPTGLSIQLLHRQLQDGLTTWMQDQNQQLDAQGRFHFGGLTAGDYKIVTAEWVEQALPTSVRVSKPFAGYPPQSYPSGSTRATAAILHLGGGQNAVADLNLRGAKYWQVEVPVVGNGPATAVQVQVASENGPGYTLAFNAKSQKVEGMLPDGIYHLTIVDVPGGARPGAIQDIRAGTGNFTVAAKPAHGAEIALLPAATIAVNVREDFTTPDPAIADAGQTSMVSGPVPAPVLLYGSGNGNPAPQILPQVVDVSMGPADRAFEGSNFGFVPALQPDPATGELRFSGVPPGRYRVQIVPRRGYVASATANGVDLLRNPLVVETGAESSAISIILRNDSGTITGAVSGASRSRLAFPIYVIAFPMGTEQVAQPAFGSSDSDSKFILPNLVPGRYLVVAGEGQPPSLEYRNKDAMEDHKSEGTVVDVIPGQTVTTTVKMLHRDPEFGGDADEGDD